MSADADLCVIGGGEAGFSAALAGAALGLRVTLVDSASTDPSWRNWDVALTALREAGLRARRGGTRPTPEPYGPFCAELDAALAAAAPDRRFARLAAMNVRVLTGRARFIDPRTVQASGESIRARRFIVATGARPAGPLGTEPRTIERLRGPRLPSHAVVAGGDPRSIALAQGLCRLGVDVTLNAPEDLLPGLDPELVEPLRLALRENGVQVRPVQYGEALGPAFHAAETIPCLADLDLGHAGIESRAGLLVLSPAMRTTNPRVYAIGGAAGGSSSQAVQAQVATVMKSAFFRLPARYEPSLVPIVTITDPEIASIGSNEAAARARGPVTVLRWPFSETTRGVSERTPGHVKVVADRRGRLVGAGIVGPAAADQIGLWVLAIRSGLTLQALADVSLPSPSFSEASRRLIVLHAASRLRSPLLRRALTVLGRLG